MELSFTSRQRGIMDTLSKSAFLKGLLDEEAKRHFSDREQLVKASEATQEKLRRDVQVAGKAHESAKKKLALAEAALREATTEEIAAWGNAHAAGVALDSEIYSLAKALGEGAHPDIGELIRCVGYYLEALPGTLHVGITTERNILGQTRPVFYSNSPELGQALERLRSIRGELHQLLESAYGDDLFVRLRRHYESVLAIAKGFELRDASGRKWEFSFLEPESSPRAAIA